MLKFLTNFNYIVSFFIFSIGQSSMKKIILLSNFFLFLAGGPNIKKLNIIKINQKNYIFQNF